jgi:crotonobetainyl-CoA:carnitine CoA-transferase CaiB-like acyl-CoA transferase
MGLVGGEGKPPIKAGGYQGQLMAGAHAAALTLFAVNGSMTTGQGSWIEASALASCAKIFAHMSEYTTIATESGLPPDIRRERQSGVLPCKDGFITVTLYYFQMEQLGQMLEITGLADDPRYSSEQNLQANQYELKKEISKWLATRTADEAQDEAQARRLLFTKVSTTQDLLESAHLQERKYFKTVKLPGSGEVTFPGAPFRLSETPMSEISAAPILGEANQEFLVDFLNFSNADLVEQDLK